ncbi:hypothetical protein DQ04_11851000 [Trypanosoma grayi]|uniref:hypothetical protein n=1 Tax=Trypanosoma grayi TaxID=71804 RepID=UPI0004F49ED0|nr:hypothetical protein DQ04_11851000 [Trypanosoma grayi]KEG06869.1 hypothetical protein DQ04_11851000 [Trypanosoma grayi]
MTHSFAKGSATSFKQRVVNLFQIYKRDLFFSFVALTALGIVFRRELMVHGVVGAPRQVEVLPKVGREFGKGKHRNNSAEDT